MHIKKDDNIIVITGSDKGKTGKVIRSLPRENKIIVDGINIHKRHRRPTRQGQKGQIIDMPFPIHVSNVKKADEEVKQEKKEKKTRTPKKTPEKSE